MTIKNGMRVMWIGLALTGLSLAGLPALAAKVNAKISQCKKTKVRNDNGERVYVFRVESRQVTQSHKTDTTLYVEVVDNKGKRYFGSLQNKTSLLSFVHGSSYSDVIWRYEINVEQVGDAMIKAYYVELSDAEGKVLDVSKYAVADFEAWKKQNAQSAPLKIVAMAPDPVLQ